MYIVSIGIYYRALWLVIDAGPLEFIKALKETRTLKPQNLKDLGIFRILCIKSFNFRFFPPPYHAFQFKFEFNPLNLIQPCV